MKYETRILADHLVVGTINNYINQGWAVFGLWPIPDPAEPNGTPGTVITFVKENS